MPIIGKKLSKTNIAESNKRAMNSFNALQDDNKGLDEEVIDAEEQLIKQKRAQNTTMK